MNGLSPLARGTPTLDSGPYLPLRFIPAGAGNTRRSFRANQPGAVYPRWRGEHRIDQHQFASIHGLSPLARGTPIPEFHPVRPQRFIPAGAGNTAQRNCSQQVITVYPRWRGEHFWLFTPSRPRGGLSPLARGTRKLTESIKRSCRFIPAGAGNTLNIYYCFLMPF